MNIRLATILVIILGASNVMAMSPSPMGPVSRDLVLARLTDVRACLDHVDAQGALDRIRSLEGMLRVDPYYAGSDMMKSARTILMVLEQDDLATADSLIEALIENLDKHMSQTALGAG